MGFVLYDVETTGVRKCFDQILEFAAIATDPELNEIDTIRCEARLQPHIIPSPTALLLNGLSISDITSPSRPSHFEMVSTIRRWLEALGGNTFLGFNSMSFDEEFLRQAFYQTLMSPYLTSTLPNTRGDVLHLMRAASAFHPELLVVPPASDGKPSFALRNLAIANGFPKFEAHTAMADASAALHLCRLVAEGAPDLWSSFQQFSQKHSVAAFIQAETAFFLFDASWIRASHRVTWIGASPSQPNLHYCLSLDADIAQLKTLDIAALTQWVQQTTGYVIRLKANRTPIILPLSDAPPHCMRDLSEAECLELADSVRSDQDFCARLLQACTACERQYPPAQYVEQQIYGGEMWPGPDQAVLGDFHALPWAERPALLDRMSDRRSWQLARRLLYAERPDLVPLKQTRQIRDGLRKRLLTDDNAVPWLTIAAARREARDLMAANAQANGKMLQELEAYLATLESAYGTALPS